MRDGPPKDCKEWRANMERFMKERRIRIASSFLDAICPPEERDKEETVSDKAPATAQARRQNFQKYLDDRGVTVDPTVFDNLYGRTEDKGESVPVLDHGYVRLDGVFGSDQDIARIARVSTGKGNKSEEADKRFIDYLMRHEHMCYHPDMEVLTANGWRRWGDLEGVEVFMVPDPAARSLRPERLRVRRFDFDGDLKTFESQRMSYAVTPNHRMYFKGKYRDEFEIVRADEMSHWGHFDPSAGYRLYDPETVTPDPFFIFVGFYLGDGYWASPNRIAFRLKKDRKIQLLDGLLRELGYEHTKEVDRYSVTVYYVAVPEDLSELIDHRARARDKALAIDEIASLPPEALEGLYLGLVESDGSRKNDRPQIQFSSTSPSLVDLFEALAAFRGGDAHRRGVGRATTTQTVDFRSEGRTSLESRKQYHGSMRYAGPVFCTTTSTGLLVVRGGQDKFGFISGNSPFEMPVMRFEIKMPVFVARQWVRHRTHSMNEYSGRYSEMPEETYLPDIERIQAQGTDNRQGSGEPLEEATATNVRFLMDIDQAFTRETYRYYLGRGVAKELARINLPLSQYTVFYWQQNLRNLLHLLALRRDGHAQPEARAYAQALEGFVSRYFPWTYEAWLKNVVEARTFSSDDLAILNGVIEHLRSSTGLSDKDLVDLIEQFGARRGLPASRVRELKEKFDHLRSRG